MRKALKLNGTPPKQTLKAQSVSPELKESFTKEKKLTESRDPPKPKDLYPSYFEQNRDPNTEFDYSHTCKVQGLRGTPPSQGMYQCGQEKREARVPEQI